MNIHLAHDAPESAKLASAILLYTNQANTIAVQHDVVTDRAGSRLGPGRFVTADIAKTLVESLDHAPLSFIPEHVVAISREAIAWYEPAQPRRMLFQCHSDPAVNAFDKQMIAQPALLFVARRNGLNVYALFSDSRPSKDTPLAMAPFYNVFDDGRVCTGSMKVPSKLDASATTQWSRAFFGSNFTHATGLKHWAHTGTYAELLQSAAKRGSFDTSWLKKDRRMVGQVCSN